MSNNYGGHSPNHGGHGPHQGHPGGGFRFWPGFKLRNYRNFRRYPRRHFRWF